MPRMSEAVTVPVLTELASLRTSSQCVSICLVLTVPPIKGARSGYRDGFSTVKILRSFRSRIRGAKRKPRRWHMAKTWSV